MSAQFDILVEALKEAILKADEARNKKQLLENNSPGLRPHPEDSHKSRRGGVAMKLGPTSEKWYDSVTNESVYITEWVVKFKPSVATIQNVGDGEAGAILNPFGMEGRLTVSYDGEQSIEDQPLNDFTMAAVRLPIAGKCIPVHGRYINWFIERDQTDASVDLDVEAAIVPGRPYTWFDADFDTAEAGASAVIPLKTYTQRISILTNLTVGDTWEYLNANGTALLLVAATAENLNSLQPIHPDAVFVRYNTADVAAKVVLVSFEIVS